MNGQTARNHSRFAYQLGYETASGACGASLIRRDVAITAAHCLPEALTEKALSKMTVYAGARPGAAPGPGSPVHGVGKRDAISAA